MKLLPYVERVAVVGDLHANIRYTNKVLKYAFREPDSADVILQIGDFGVWGNFVEQVEHIMATEYPDKYVLFVDGNHENHTRLDYHEIDEEVGVKKLTDHVWHLPRGYRWRWGTTDCMAVGGAISVDREFRVPGHDWFPRERMSPEEYIKCITPGKVDVVFAHDAPGTHPIPNIPPAGTFPDGVIADAKYYRYTVVNNVGEHTKPELWFHGHYHSHYEEVIFWEDGSPCIVQGLNCDRNPLSEVVHFWDIPNEV